MTPQRPVAHLRGEQPDCTEHAPNIGHHIAAVQHNGLRPAVAQCRVQDGALFGCVDTLAGEHGRAPLRHTGFFCQPAEQRKRLGQDQVLGKVEEHAGASGAAAREALRVGAEQVAQVMPGDFVTVRDEAVPGGQLGEHRG